MTGKKCSGVLVVIFLLCLLVHCKEIRFIPGRQEIDYASHLSPFSDKTTLRSGHRLYISKCGKCHQLYSVGSYKESEWEDIIPEMARKAHLAKNEEEQVRLYVICHRHCEHDTLEAN